MRFFIDTANVEEIRKANEYGSDLWSDNQPVFDRKRRQGL